MVAMTSASLSLRIVQAVLFAVLLVGALLAKFAPPIWLNLTGLALCGVGLFGLWVIGSLRMSREPHV